MGDFFPAFWGGALLIVVLALGELSRPVARLLCALDQHRWRSSAHAPRLRHCARCQRRERTCRRHPHPWDWERT